MTAYNARLLIVPDQVSKQWNHQLNSYHVVKQVAASFEHPIPSITGNQQADRAVYAKRAEQLHRLRLGRPYTCAAIHARFTAQSGRLARLVGSRLVFATKEPRLSITRAVTIVNLDVGSHWMLRGQGRETIDHVDMSEDIVAIVTSSYWCYVAELTSRNIKSFRLSAGMMRAFAIRGRNVYCGGTEADAPTIYCWNFDSETSRVFKIPYDVLGMDDRPPVILFGLLLAPHSRSDTVTVFTAPGWLSDCTNPDTCIHFAQFDMSGLCIQTGHQSIPTLGNISFQTIHPVAEHRVCVGVSAKMYRKQGVDKRRFHLIFDLQRFCFVEHHSPLTAEPSLLVDSTMAWLKGCYYETVLRVINSHDGLVTLALGSKDNPTKAGHMLPQVCPLRFEGGMFDCNDNGSCIRINDSYMVVFASWDDRIVIYGFDPDTPLPQDALQALGRTFGWEARSNAFVQNVS
ncbi:hypothetical protein EJ04DRAFT_509762 [Polyplosphaeria fusca]|uniref:Uncharacterized protein n=1 Tax=Polyplosphaeria fusca TaxID=682080 RepID=A0A9P4R7E3_9PLEO|nr:hypothetical protein EJ04DRAFT_509762 [Polyplosphaeria fusca]